MTRSADARTANLLGAASLGVTDAIEQSMLGAAGMDGSAPAALVAFLDLTPHGSVRALSRAVGLTHSGAVRLADRLVAAGYLERGPGVDARSLALALTPAGRQLALRVRAARGDAIDGAMALLTGEQRGALADICESLVAQLTTLRLEQRAAGGEPAGGALCRLCDFGACRRPEGLCPAATTAARGLPTAPG